MSEVNFMAYLIINHVHKMHIPLMAIESMLMKKVIISTQSGGMPTLLNKENCIVVKKNSSFLKKYLTIF